MRASLVLAAVCLVLLASPLFAEGAKPQAEGPVALTAALGGSCGTVQSAGALPETAAEPLFVTSTCCESCVAQWEGCMASCWICNACNTVYNRCISECPGGC